MVQRNPDKYMAEAFKNDEAKIPVGVSNRHVHLADRDLIALFGDDAKLTNFKGLSQPGQFASEQLITLVGPNGVIEKVRVLGPTRKKTQVEISVSDCFKLGIKAPIRDSGDLKDSAQVTLVGPAGSVTIEEGCIIAARHIHMHHSDAVRYGVQDGDRVTVKVSGPRGVMFYEVLVRVHENYKLEMHIDMDEANAACLRNNDSVEIITN
ncbi:phosphate propanoyltransferase [Desulforamulus aquiferis]|uniref:Phosphate propanoyltransferase n=2 Tax=Desulforamulus aquiferis TaxID=1397668 RepID=A0AAW7ZFZ9_9FIRM|nr:phosphate propanoyltransferase [Desulforamulus aquiferis]MDO7787710.1 phosphate propanoyltransferase [Desulforamulus aquiferis]